MVTLPPHLAPPESFESNTGWGPVYRAMLFVAFEGGDVDRSLTEQLFEIVAHCMSSALLDLSAALEAAEFFSNTCVYDMDTAFLCATWLASLRQLIPHEGASIDRALRGVSAEANEVYGSEWAKAVEARIVTPLSHRRREA